MIRTRMREIIELIRKHPNMRRICDANHLIFTTAADQIYLSHELKQQLPVSVGWMPFLTALIIHIGQQTNPSFQCIIPQVYSQNLLHSFTTMVHVIVCVNISCKYFTKCYHYDRLFGNLMTWHALG